MGGGRRRELDGLRGIAALVVVFHHVALLDPALAAVVLGQETATGWRALLAYTPFHLVWAGTEAVAVFFVLSGYVLVRPYVQGRELRTLRYLARRSRRLYVPVAAGVGVAVVVRVAATYLPGWGAETGPWFASFWRVTDGLGVARDMSLLWTESSSLSVLWSLRWEVIFSALLPVLVILGRRPWALCVVAVAASLLWPSTAVMMVPFVLGAAVARWETHLVSVRPGWGWVALPLLTAHWMVASKAGVPSVTAPLTMAGAALLLVAVLNGFGRQVLTSAGAVWVGARSYSLYLVHEPVLILLAVALGTTNPAIGVVVIPVSLGAARLFHHAVEVPASGRGERAPHLDLAEHQVVGRA